MVFLDNSFGNNGKVVTSLNLEEVGWDLAIDASGNIFVAGSAYKTPNDFSDYDFKLLRYNSSGVRDTSFDGTGNFPKSVAFGSTIALQTDGKVLVGGQTFNSSFATPNDEAALARYNPNGSLDSSFGLNGALSTDFSPSSDSIGSIQPLSDGNILVAGFGYSPTFDVNSDYDFILARYTSSGGLDTSFKATGIIRTDFGGNDYGSSLLLQPDDKAIVIGYTDANGNEDFALARYDSNGNLDPSFGTAGKTITDLAGFSDRAYSATLQADGKILVVGTTRTTPDSDFDNSNDNFAITRYNADGTLDTTFGTGGKVTLDFFGKDDNAASVHVQPDGKIVVTGTVGNISGASFNADFGVVRFNANGTLDTSFGTGGKLITDLGGQDRVSRSVLVNGKLTVLGNTDNNTGSSIALVRYVLSQQPTDLSLSSLSVAENQPVGSVVGTLSTIDPDTGDSFTYNLISGSGSTDNAAFEIVGNQLKTKQAFDFETKNSYSIRVKTTDAFGASIEKELKISVTDVAENLVPVKPKPKGDPIVGTSKNDRLVGTTEDDLIRGLKGNDKLVGRAANDILVGGLGNDILKGGVGDDVLRGGGGTDICFLQNNGLDTVQQFSDGQDKLKLTGGLTFSNLVITQQGSDVLIGTATSKFALITGITVSQITAADFV